MYMAERIPCHKSWQIDSYDNNNNNDKSVGHNAIREKTVGVRNSEYDKCSYVICIVAFGLKYWLLLLALSIGFF